MDINAAFPSKYLKAADLPGPVTVTIGICKMEDIGDDRRPVLYFQGKDKGLVLNKTNSRRITKLFGADTDSWTGQPLEIYPSETEFKGETVECLRVRAAQKKALPADDTPPPPEGSGSGTFEEPPF